MSREKGRIKYHYGFYAAMRVEYDLMHADLEYDQEVQLGEEPIRLDFLIIKKSPDVVLTDPIGEYFEAVNIFEYKSPEDALSINDFYKALGYSFIYKGDNKKVEKLSIRDMTLTLVRHSYPRELMKALIKDGFKVEERYPGIYRIYAYNLLKVQLIVSSRLPRGEYDGLHLLAKGCTKDDVIRYAEKAAATEDGNVQANIDTVLSTCLDINKKVGKQLEEDKDMSDVIKKIVRRHLDEARQEGINEIKESVATDMLRNGEPLDKILRYSRLAEDTIRSLASSLGIAVV